MSVWYDTAQNVFLIPLRPSCLNEPDGTITHDLIDRGLGLSGARLRVSPLISPPDSELESELGACEIKY